MHDPGKFLYMELVHWACVTLGYLPGAVVGTGFSPGQWYHPDWPRVCLSSKLPDDSPVPLGLVDLNLPEKEWLRKIGEDDESDEGDEEGED